MRRRGSIYLKRFALIAGAIFVLTGVAALVGDADEAAPSKKTAVFVRALRSLREAFGDPGGGIAMIAVGLLLGGLLYWAAGRKS